MILPLFRRPGRTIDALYGAIVAQARAAHFYAEMGVPDTVSGRFDMVLLHVVLVLRRLREGEAGERALAQGLFDAFCRDMDHNLREMGISDQGLPRHMQRVGEAFYGPRRPTRRRSARPRMRARWRTRWRAMCIRRPPMASVRPRSRAMLETRPKYLVRNHSRRWRLALFRFRNRGFHRAVTE